MARIGPSLAALILVAAAVQAQPGSRSAGAATVRIADSTVLEAPRAGISRSPLMAMHRNGTIAVTGDNLSLALFDTLGRKRWERSLHRELRNINSIGWRDDSLYLVDNLRDEVLFISANGGVGSSVEFPDLIRPQWKDRSRMPAYGTIDVYAATPDGSLIGTPRRPHRMAVYGAVGTDTLGTRVRVLRIDADGIVQNQLGVIVNDVKGDQWYILGDGRLMVLRQRPDSISFVGISPRGDTIFSRRLPKARQVIAAVGGPDSTIWVTTGNGTPTLTHSLYDGQGNLLGQITLPVTMRVGAGDARHVWVFDGKAGVNRGRIVRYTLR